MKRFMSIVILAALLVTILPFNGNATETDNDNIVYFEDGSYLKIDINASQFRASGTKTGRKTVEYYSSDDELVWKAVLSGTFTYTGAAATCTASSCDVSIYNTAWYVVSKTTGKTGGTATAEITMGRKLLGITVDRVPVSISLTCDANGNLS